MTTNESSTMAIDIEKSQREYLRWMIMVVLNAGRPVGAAESMILSSILAIPMVVTQREIRRELDYLENRKLVELEGRGTRPQWHARLTHHGVDLVEYTTDCLPGIARPNKWW